MGIFIDSSGNDRYERKLKTSYGHANTARQSGSIGIFLDMGGDDIYPNEHQENNSSWVSGIYGLGKDLEISEAKTEESIEITESIEKMEESDNFEGISIQELFAKASEWEVGDAVERVRIARLKILEREEEAIEFIIENKIMTKSGLELRAILDFVRNSDLMKARLPEALEHEHFRAVGNTIYIIGEIKDVSFLDIFESMLSENKYIGSILSALGNFERDKSIDLLELFMASDNVYHRVTTARSLKQINTERSIDLLLSMKDDECFLIQTMIELEKNIKE